SPVPEGAFTRGSTRERRRPSSSGALHHRTTKGARMRALIEAQGLAKRFGKVQALTEFTLNLPGGQPVAILGPNGAGKTTFIRMVATLLDPDRGPWRAHGHDVVHDPRAGRRIIGLAGQSAAIEETMPGRENLEMVARLYGQGRTHAQASARR